MIFVLFIILKTQEQAEMLFFHITSNIQMYQDENGMLLIIMLIWTSFVSQFVHPVEGEEME